MSGLLLLLWSGSRMLRPNRDDLLHHSQPGTGSNRRTRRSRQSGPGDETERRPGDEVLCRTGPGGGVRPRRQHLWWLLARWGENQGNQRCRRVAGHWWYRSLAASEYSGMSREVWRAPIVLVCGPQPDLPSPNLTSPDPSPPIHFLFSSFICSFGNI